MRKIIFALIGIVLLLATKAYAYDDHDFQVWNTDVEEIKINEKWKVATEQEFRWGDNASQMFYQHYDLGAFYTFNKYLNIGTGYRHILSKSKGEYKIENELYITMTASWQLSGLKFEDRNRFEYQHFDYQTDSGRYRNKITVKLPWKFTKLEIQPFVSDEVFVHFMQKDAFNQNRFSAGLSLNLTKNIKGELYYMLQSSKGTSVWTDANVLGTKLKIAF